MQSNGVSSNKRSATTATNQSLSFTLRSHESTIIHALYTKQSNNKHVTLRHQTIKMVFIAASTLNTVATPLQADAESLEPTNKPPLTIQVEQVTITDQDLDRAAKFCLIKEGVLDPQSIKGESPTPAQTVVMATMCP